MGADPCDAPAPPLAGEPLGFEYDGLSNADFLYVGLVNIQHCPHRGSIGNGEEGPLGIDDLAECAGTLDNDAGEGCGKGQKRGRVLYLRDLPDLSVREPQVPKSLRGAGEGDSTLGQLRFSLQDILFGRYVAFLKSLFTSMIPLPEVQERLSLEVLCFGRSEIGRVHDGKNLSALHGLSQILFDFPHNPRRARREMGVPVAVIGDFRIAGEGLRDLSTLHAHVFQAGPVSDLRGKELDSLGMDSACDRR